MSRDQQKMKPVSTKDKETASVKGLIFKIQPFSIHDGPGIRTVMFLKGCPLHCFWCHNPEGISSRIDLLYHTEKCIDCHTCETICGHNVHAWNQDEHQLNRSLCAACGLCVNSCPTDALELVGQRITAGEALNQLLRDRRYYLTSNGGITLSGGEPLLQVEFTAAVLELAGQHELHRAIETSGAVSEKAFQDVLPLTDLFLFDIKETEPSRLKQLTGADYSQVLHNLHVLRKKNAHVILRCPIIPSVNDRSEHLDKLADISQSMDYPLELLPYHKLGSRKVDQLGMADRPAYVQPEQKIIRQWQAYLTDKGAAVVGD